MVKYTDTGTAGEGVSYLLPAPDGPETVKESHVLEQIRIEPQPRRDGEDGDAEQDQSEDGHGEEETDQTEHAHAQVPHADPQLDGPEREQHHGHDERQRPGRVQLRLPLRAVLQPDEVQLVADLLLLLDLDRPETLGALLGLPAVVVPLVRVDLGDAQGEQRERQELEDLLGRGAVGDGWKESGVLGRGGRVGGGLDRS